MHDVALKAVVSNPDGSLFYREEHEWTGVDDNMLLWFNTKLQHMEKVANQLHGKNEDSANLSAVLTQIVDGVAQSLTFTGVSYHALMKFEHEAHKVNAELLSLGDVAAATKK